jgi:hypothetical protein
MARTPNAGISCTIIFSKRGGEVFGTMADDVSCTVSYGALVP